MSKARVWTCHRQAAGVKCGQPNPLRRVYCTKCGKPRPPRKRPEHLKALDLPYDHYVQLGGGIERCGICGATGKTRRLHRDHDHATGAPRGVLCFRDNAALRSYMTVEWLRAAADYLERAQQRA